jgi:hypothetical protein
VREIAEKLKSLPVTYSSDYFEVREAEVDGERYRLVKQFAGSGKQKRQLPLRIEKLDTAQKRWVKVWEEE